MPRTTLSLNLAERERARTVALFRSIGDGVIATNELGMITDINRPALKMLGYRKRDVLGRWFPTAIQVVDEEGVELAPIDRPASQAMISGKPVTANVFYLTNSGTILPVSVTVAPVMIDHHPRGIVEVFRDISQEHEVDRMKSEFISIASHQLRTPLTAIKTYSHMLVGGFGGKLQKQQKDFLNIIINSVERMNDLINTLLDLSRIEEGRLAIAQRFVNLDTVMDEAITELRPAADAKKIKIEVNYQSDNLNATTDPLLVKEVFSNLLSNAIKYTPMNGHVDVNVAATDDNFIFSVSDNGYGIPAADHGRVFSKFYRGENILDKDTTGTGLGLYLVKKIVEGLSGDIKFTSKENEGSCFEFRLPR